MYLPPEIIRCRRIIYCILEYLTVISSYDIFMTCHPIMSKDAGTGVHYGGTAHLPFEMGETGAQVPLHTSVVSNFMIYQDQFETNLLQVFAHT